MWWSDVRLAVRALLRRPGFSGTVLLTLALGVGTTTALFGVFRAVFLAPLELPEADEIVVIMQTGSIGCCGPASGPDYVDWVERERSFDGLAAMSPATVKLTGLEEATRAYGLYVTASAFDFLGVDPILGRALREEEQTTQDVVVLSHGLWMRLFSGDPSVIGSGVEIEGRTRTVVGVMPDGFDVPSPWQGTRTHELYLAFPEEAFTRDRGSHAFPVIGRMAEGVSLEAAQEDMSRIMRELAVEYPLTNAERGVELFGMHEYMYGEVGRQLLLILGAAGLVLLIACGNVAGLQLARGVGREGELAVRAALGASRTAIVRLLFSESLVLAAVGGVLGIVVSLGVLDLLRGVLPSSFPRVDDIRIDGVALGFALAASAATALLFGMLPAVLAARTDVASRVREGGRGTASRGKERVRDGFIVAQIAIGLVLANGASLLVRSYSELRGQGYGFEAEGVLTLSIDPSGPRYEETSARERYLAQVMERVGEIPGVRSVGMVTRLPLNGGSNGNVQVEDRAPRASRDEGPLVEATSVAGDYFDVMGIPLTRGRLLVADDSIPEAVGVLINETMAEEVWPDEDPLGKRFAYGDPPPWLTVVGVVGDVRQWNPEQEPLPQVYLPYARGWSTSGYLTVRVDGDAARAAPEIRRALLAIDPTQPPSAIRAMDDRLESEFARRRFYTTLIGAFAVAALLLASAGIYGTVSYYVSRRTRELGIRIALGSASAGLVGLVVRRGIRLALLGIAIGLVGVWATVSIAESLVYGVSAIDPLSVVAGCLVLGLVAVLASVIPAARAVRVSPSLALRSE